MSSPLDWFGLPAEANERDLKRAYARRIKSVRPDTDPAGFQELHDRYQHALAWLAQMRADRPTAPGRTGVSLDAALVDSAVEAPLPSAPAASQDPANPQPEISRQAGAWHPVRFASDAAEPEPMFDLAVFTADCLDLAVADNTEALLSWLQQQPELWSLQLKQEAGRALVQRLFCDPPPIRMGCFDAMLAFFGLDQAFNGINPLHLQRLRLTMQERHALVQRFNPAVQAWGADRQRLDIDACFDWFCELALDGGHELLAAKLFAQPALRTPALRQHATPRLLERLLRERPPMPSECSWLLLDFFALQPLLAQRGQPPDELVAQLRIEWLLLPRNSRQLAVVPKHPKERFTRPTDATRRARWLRQPFRWWWVALAALAPQLLRSMGVLARDLSDGELSRLDACFTPRLTRFCVAVADRGRVAWPRVFVGGVRCLLFVVVGSVAGGLLYGDDPIDARLVLAIAPLLTAAWLYWMAFCALALWQQRPEDPVQPHPLLRMSFVPVLALGGLAVYFATLRYFLPQLLTLPAFVLAYLRLLVRNPKPASGKTPSARLRGYGLLATAWIMLSNPIPPVAGALLLWAIDLFKQGKRLRFRYRAETAPPPMPQTASEPA